MENFPVNLRVFFTVFLYMEQSTSPNVYWTESAFQDVFIWECITWRDTRHISFFQCGALWTSGTPCWAGGPGGLTCVHGQCYDQPLGSPDTGLCCWAHLCQASTAQYEFEIVLLRKNCTQFVLLPSKVSEFVLTEWMSYLETIWGGASMTFPPPDQCIALESSSAWQQEFVLFTAPLFKICTHLEHLQKRVEKQPTACRRSGRQPALHAPPSRDRKLYSTSNYCTQFVLSPHYNNKKCTVKLLVLTGNDNGRCWRDAPPPVYAIAPTEWAFSPDEFVLFE